MLEGEVASLRKLASAVAPGDRLGFARAIAFRAMSAYWNERRNASCRALPMAEPPDVPLAAIGEDAREKAAVFGKAAAELDISEAGYAIGAFYTGTMPSALRAALGAYYTPPTLCERLLDNATEAGVDWRFAHVLDPACGGGAFLAPVARRMAESLKESDPGAALHSIQHRLTGFERDPFAAWMSQVFLDETLYDLYDKAGVRLAPVLRVCNSLERTPADEGFDLVVGNPPYGRVSLPPELRGKFRRSLFGHANLYGLFTDLALRFARPGGVIAYVTPTSFLSGEYFKALRGLLAQEAPPFSIDFIGERRGVFADVLQEALLAVYRRGRKPGIANVHFLSAGSLAATAAGTFRLPEKPDRPWLVPRAKAHCALVSRVRDLPYRLSDYGYTVSTGPLVWNRHKDSLKVRPGKGRYPLLWAESVRSEGVFKFRAEKRNHKPYFEPKPDERWVMTDFPCVLLQRTTAKEQCRRLIAAELPAEFLEEHGAVAVENHLNMIKPIDDAPCVAPSVLAFLLNSEVVDKVFRCINGSVAVSAYELEALPLPAPADMEEIERLMERRAKRRTLERAVERMYLGKAG